MNSTGHYTYEEFLTYLLLFGAKADLIINEEEEAGIIARVGSEVYKKVKRDFDNHNDAQHIANITALYNKFKSQAGGKENLVKELKEVVRAENKEGDMMDHLLMTMLQRIL